MAGNIRCSTNQRIITDLPDLHHVICYQTMASLDQLQCRLTFTDTALTSNQYALAGASFIPTDYESGSGRKVEVIGK